MGGLVSSDASASGAVPPDGTAPAGSQASTAAVGTETVLSPFDAVRRRGVQMERVGLPHGTLRPFVLPDPDALLDALTQEEFDRNDGRMPYWATLWASALALADVVLSAPLSGPASLAGRRVLDLGCGLGLVGLAALVRGAHVTLLDWEADAVAIARASAWAAGHWNVEGVVADWRSPPPLRPFDVVLGADVLYEERNGPAVAQFLATHLAPAGEAWIVDPGRRHAEHVPSLFAAAGLVVRARDPLLPRDRATSLVLWRVGRAPHGPRQNASLS
jgi:predicted nicotinamide N-methyase